MKTFVTYGITAITFVLSQPAIGQDHSMHGMPMAQQPAAAKTVAAADASALGEGVVKKIDKVKGTVTLAHGALPNGMPPMTMAYKVKDKAWLEPLKAGQKIRFATDPADGSMTVTKIEWVK